MKGPHPMKYAYFDASSGLSGDMILGALLDLGASTKTFKDAMAELKLPVEIRTKEVTRAGLRGLKVDVVIKKGGESPARHWHDIESLVLKSPFSEPVKERALGAFRVLFEAEAKVHGSTFHDVHLHEAGADDAMVDVVGSAFLREELKISRVYCSPLNLGSGWVKASHGRLPVPPPAVAEILKTTPVYSAWADQELVTPTGAAILAALARPGDPGAFVPISVGYGAGDRELADRPNLLRVIVGEPAGGEDDEHGHHHAHGSRSPGSFGPAASLVADEMVVLEADVDDMNPQFWEAAREALFAAGARDVTLGATSMKKGRPGMLLRVVAAPEARDRLAAVVLSETSTIGVRFHAVSRLTLPRRIERVGTPWGEVAVKVVTLPDGSERAAPEYDDCLRIAREHAVPVPRVHEAALVAAASRGIEQA